MNYEYRMIQLPPTITVTVKEWRGQEAAFYLQNIANEQSVQGWEFFRVDTVGVMVQPGCLAMLLGAKQTLVEYFVVTFRRAR